VGWCQSNIASVLDGFIDLDYCKGTGCEEKIHTVTPLQRILDKDAGERKRKALYRLHIAVD